MALTFGFVCICGIICALSFGPLSDSTIFGMTFFDLLDYVTSNIGLPLGGMLISIFMGWIVRRSTLEKELKPSPRIIVNFIIFLLRYICPVAILLVFLNNLIS